MTRLKKRERNDLLRSETRPKKGRKLAKNVYLVALAVLALALFDMAAGKLFYLKAEGMVSRNLSIVAPEYTGTVQSLDVIQGAPVAEGQRVALLRSQKMLRDIVGSSAQLAQLQAKLSEMRIRNGTLDTLIPAAQARVHDARKESRSLFELASSGLATNRMRNEAADGAFRALEDLKRLETDARLIESESRQIADSVDRANDALSELESIYNKGLLRAPSDGTIGIVTVKPGSVVREGDTVMEIFHGETFVLAYVPVGALYKIESGDDVTIRFGFHSLPGRVERTLPLAHRLPQEFQKTFDTAQRKQLVRIAIETDRPLPPLFTKVSISWPWTPKAVLTRLVTHFNG